MGCHFEEVGDAELIAASIQIVSELLLYLYPPHHVFSLTVEFSTDRTIASSGFDEPAGYRWVMSKKELRNPGRRGVVVEFLPTWAIL